MLPHRHYLEFLAHVAAMGIEVLAQVLWLPKHLLPESVGCFKNPSGTDYLPLKAVDRPCTGFGRPSGAGRRRRWQVVDPHSPSKF